MTPYLGGNMKNIIITLTILFAITCWADTVLFTANYESLTELSTNDEIQPMHIAEDYYIAQGNSESLSTLRNVQILRSSADISKLYLVSHPTMKKLDSNQVIGNVILNKGNLYLVESTLSELELTLNSPYKYVKLNPMVKRSSQKLEAPQAVYGNSRDEMEDLVNAVNADSIASIIQSMQDMQTRYAFADNAGEVAEWIKEKFESYGYTDVIIDSFYYADSWHRDVIATLPGSIHPDNNILIGGHHDSIVHFGEDIDPMVFAPGADDNASAVAAVLEVARIMKESNFSPDLSIKFATFGAEEVGLWGSHYLADKMYNEGTQLRMMLNNDMIANNNASPDEWELDIPTYSGSEYLTEISINLMEEFTTLNYGNSISNSSSSDSYAFWIRGFPTAYYFEAEFSPYYHSNLDILDNCDIPYCQQVVKLNMSMMALMSLIPEYVADLSIHGAGTGSSVQMNWSASDEPDFDHYWVGIRELDGTEVTSFTTNETEFTFNELEEGVTYAMGVSVVDTEGYQSLTASGIATPMIIPATPDSFSATPANEYIALNWAENLELDIQGYNLLRSSDPETEPEILHSEILTENSFNDDTAQAGQFYYYSLEAVDIDGNLSPRTEVLRSRLLSLDQGILLITDTADGAGNFMHPTLAEVDEFYAASLQGFANTSFTPTATDSVRLDVLGAYSTVIWTFDDSPSGSDIKSSREVIASYLEAGGNIIISGFKPTTVMAETSVYPLDTADDDFLRNTLKIATADFSNMARFQTAVPFTDDLSQLEVDPNKVPPNLEGHLINVESITATEEGIDLYSYGNNYAEGHPFSAMNGTTVGVGYYGTDYNAVTLGFPLYYMNLGQVNNWITSTLEVFGEETSTTNNQVPASDIVLSNYPNPFNPETTIKFQLPQGGNTELSVFNTKGQLVKKLQSGHLDKGTHTVLWNGKDEQDRPVGSGIYFYKLKSASRIRSKKMLLLK